MAGRFLEAIPDMNVTELFHWDESEQKMTLETVQDITELVEENKAHYNEVTSLDRFNDMRRVASIPMSLYLDLQKKGITRDPAAMRKWLNDPDNRVFRTWPGRV